MTEAYALFVMTLCSRKNTATAEAGGSNIPILVHRLEPLARNERREYGDANPGAGSLTVRIL